MAQINIQVFPDGKAFLDAAAPWLMREELVRSLPYALAHRHLDGRTMAGERVFFAIVRRGGEIVAAVVRTPPMKANLVGNADDEEAAAALVPVMREACPGLQGVFGPEPLAAAFASRWQAISGERLANGDRIALHVLGQLVPAKGVSGELRRPTTGELPQVFAWMQAFHAEANPSAPLQQSRMEQIARGDAGDLVWLWADAGTPVCMCFTTRDTPNGRCIAGVYTPPALRGRGYASGLVGAVTQHSLDNGKSLPYLYTDLSNPTSNKIYAALGYRFVERLINIAFIN